MSENSEAAQAAEAMDSVTFWWSMLGREVDDLTDARTLTAGASGAAVYHLRVKPGHDDFILKVSTEREMHFYRDLAALVPVAVPKLVTAIPHDHGSCLLFEASGVPPETGYWHGDRWEALAGQLGGLHSDRIAAAAAGWSWAKPAQPVAEAQVAAAAQIWASLGYEPLLSNVFARFDRLRTALTKLPVCLLHGDWHLGNILLGPSGRHVWIDWQETGFGHGPEDLALLWQRAEFDGLDPPREAMLAAYARARGIPDDGVLHDAAVAAELALLLLAWPPYLADAPEPHRARLLRRLEILTLENPALQT